MAVFHLLLSSNLAFPSLPRAPEASNPCHLTSFWSS